MEGFEQYLERSSEEARNLRSQIEELMKEKINVVEDYSTLKRKYEMMRAGLPPRLTHRAASVGTADLRAALL
jgi:hypothetical protein